MPKLNFARSSLPLNPISQAVSNFVQPMQKTKGSPYDTALKMMMQNNLENRRQQMQLLQMSEMQKRAEEAQRNMYAMMLQREHQSTMNEGGKQVDDASKYNPNSLQLHDLLKSKLNWQTTNDPIQNSARFRAMTASLKNINSQDAIQSSGFFKEQPTTDELSSMFQMKPQDVSQIWQLDSASNMRDYGSNWKHPDANMVSSGVNELMKKYEGNTEGGMKWLDSIYKTVTGGD